MIKLVAITIDIKDAEELRKFLKQNKIISINDDEVYYLNNGNPCIAAGSPLEIYTGIVKSGNKIYTAPFKVALLK